MRYRTALLVLVTVAAMACSSPTVDTVGKVIFHFEDPHTARALSPKVYDVIDHVHAVMTPDLGTAIEVDIKPEIAQKSSFSLGVDSDWTIDFTAVNSGGQVVARASLSVKAAELREAGLVKAVVLRPTSNDQGMFSVDFRFPASVGMTPNFSIRTFPDTTPSSVTAITNLSNTSGVSSALSDQPGHDLSSAAYSYDDTTGKITVSGSVPSGTYQLILQLESGETYSAIVSVFDRLVTKGTVANTVRYVRFHANGGTGSIENLPIPYGLSEALPENTFDRPGWFGDWNTVSALNGVHYDAGDLFLMDSADGADLYADWQAQITFVPGLGTGASNASSMGEGMTAPLWTMTGMTRAGYSFDGWNTALDGSGTAYADGASFTMGPAGSLTLFAQWTLIPIENFLSTSLAAYTGAAVNDLVPVTASEYALVQSGLGASAAGYTGAISNSWATGTATANQSVTYQADFPAVIGGSSTSTTTTLPVSSWARAVTFIPAINNAGGASPVAFDFRLKVYDGTAFINLTNLYTGSVAPFTVAGRYYFVIKLPSTQVASSGTSYIAAYTTATNGIGTVSIGTSGNYNLYRASGDVNGPSTPTSISENWNQIPTVQVLTTLTPASP